MRRASTLASSCACVLVVAHASAAEQGDVVYVSNLGVPLYTHNFDTGKDVGIGDRQYLSEFMGAHYFATDRIRVGLVFQTTEQVGGALPAGADRFSTFAVLPQVGWNFYDHFLASAIFVYSLRAGGKAQYDLGVQGLIGYGVTLPHGATLGLALEVPYNFHLARTIGLTPLVGLAFPL